MIATNALGSKVFCLSLIILLCGCVGSGKFKTLQTAKSQSEVELSDQISKLKSERDMLISSERQLRGDLITQNTLLSSLLADKLNLEKEIARLNQSMGQLSSESQSQQDLLNQELQKQNVSLERKEAILNQLIDNYRGHEISLREISSQLSEKLSDYREDQIEWYLASLHLDVIFYNNFLFRSPRNLSDKAAKGIDALLSIIVDYPSLQIVVVGHTDNDQKLQRSALETSALNASKVARYLLEAGGVNSNQITVSGRGGFAPRVSNQTPAGRQLNNRVEISIRASQSEINQLIKNQF